jgi:hypothetical protein
MRWLACLTVLLLCGCLESQKEIQKVYVCPDQRQVDDPVKCQATRETTTTTVSQLPTTTSEPAAIPSTTQTTQSTTTTSPDECSSLRELRAAACIAVREGNASKCPYNGLEYLDETLTDSLFSTLGRDLIGEGRKNLIEEVFAKRETCVMAIINRLNSSTECEGFPYRQLCLEKFIVDADDPGACDKIQQGPIQQGCYYALIRLKNSREACLKYPEYDDCLVRIAAEKDDTSLCRSAYGNTKEDGRVASCLAEVKLERCLHAEGSGVDCCAQVQDNMKKDCYAQKLRATNDTVWCKKDVGGDKYEDDWGCHTLIASRTDNPQICDNITSTSWHDYCLQEVVHSTGRTILCNKIIDDSKRRTCMLVDY